MIFIVKYLRWGEMGIKAFISREKAIEEVRSNFYDRLTLSEIENAIGIDVEDQEIDGEYDYTLTSSKEGSLVIEIKFEECNYVSLEQFKKPRKIKDWIQLINSNFEL